jgi:periplasmic divalent cation tolerance protein
MDDLKEFTTAPSPQTAERARHKNDCAAILIYTTFPSESEAKSAGRALVEQGLAACVNIFPQMTSIYAWEGQVEESGEAAMIVKTVRMREVEVLAEIKRLHPYTVPARLVLPLSGGGEDFLRWITEQCSPAGKCDGDTK